MRERSKRSNCALWTLVLAKSGLIRATRREQERSGGAVQLYVKTRGSKYWEGNFFLQGVRVRVAFALRSRYARVQPYAHARARASRSRLVHAHADGAAHILRDGRARLEAVGIEGALLGRGVEQLARLRWPGPLCRGMSASNDEPQQQQMGVVEVSRRAA